MLTSITTKTLKQYTICYKKWWEYCLKNSNNPYTKDFNAILLFLVEYSKSNLSYSSLNCYRSALSLIFTFNLEEEKILKRFFKGVYNKKPATPKYSATWDPNPVLEFLSTLFPLESLTLKNLTLKLVTLLLLTSGHRVQTISKISIDHIHQNNKKIEIRIPARIKTSGMGKKQPYLVFPFFKNKPELCVASTLQHYLNTTKNLRSNDSLILTHKKPYHAASTQSISRWVKEVLEKSNIDTKIFKSHSVRHAATSTAFRSGLDIDLIRNTAGWTEKSLVFNTFYNLPLAQRPEDFATCIIDNNRYKKN